MFMSTRASTQVCVSQGKCEAREQLFGVGFPLLPWDVGMELTWSGWREAP